MEPEHNFSNGGFTGRQANAPPPNKLFSLIARLGMDSTAANYMFTSNVHTRWPIQRKFWMPQMREAPEKPR